MKNSFIIGTACLILVSCSNSKTDITSGSDPVRIPVSVVKPVEKEFTPSVELSGTAFADREANLGAALPGRVETIYFPEGSSVKKGDLLVSMSAELYTQALVELNTLEKDYERVSRLNEKGSISTQDYDHIKALYDASKLRVEMMKKNTEIVAPFSGTITEYLVQPGENYFFNLNLDPGYSTTSGILRLMRLDPLQVEVDVNEKDLPKLKIGTQAILEFDAVPDSVFSGKISGIDPVLSTLTHSAKVKVEVRNSKYLLKPGMFADVRFKLNPVKSLCVPQTAVFRQSGTANDYVYLAENGKVRKQKVEKLWVDGETIGISGITSDVTIVTNGKEKLIDGALIDIR